MPAKRLTELSVSTLKPSPRGPVDYYDAVERRLVLRVGKTSKVWRVVFRNSGGKIRSEGIGRWPELDVKNARIKAAALKSAARNASKIRQFRPNRPFARLPRATSSATSMLAVCAPVAKSDGTSKTS